MKDLADVRYTCCRNPRKKSRRDQYSVIQFVAVYHTGTGTGTGCSLTGIIVYCRDLYLETGLPYRYRIPYRSCYVLLHYFTHHSGYNRKIQILAGECNRSPLERSLRSTSATTKRTSHRNTIPPGKQQSFFSSLLSDPHWLPVRSIDDDSIWSKHFASLRHTGRLVYQVIRSNV